MATKEGNAIEALSEDQARQNQRTDQQRNARTSVNGWRVFLSFPTSSVKFLSFKRQVRLSLNRVSLRLTEVSSFVNLCFLAFGSSEKDSPCNKLYLYSFIIVSSFVSHNTFLKTLRHQFLNRKEQKRNRPLTRLFFPSAYRK